MNLFLTCPFPSVIIPLAAKADGEWCNGSTYDSDSYCLGSNPSSPAFLFLAPLSRGLGRGPLKAETRVRIPSELLEDPAEDCRVFLCLDSSECPHASAVTQSSFVGTRSLGQLAHGNCYAIENDVHMTTCPDVHFEMINKRHVLMKIRGCGLVDLFFLNDN